MMLSIKKFLGIVETITLDQMFKSGPPPKGVSLHTGPKGGQYYESGGKRIYVGQKFQTPHAAAMHKKITGLAKLDEVTTSIFHIDKLVSSGKILKEEVDALYQSAENQMRTIQTQAKQIEEKKHAKRAAIVGKKRAVQEHGRKKRDQATIKKFNERLRSVKRRVGRWKEIANKMDGIEHRVGIARTKIDQKLAEIKPAVSKLRDKKESLRMASQKIPKGHPQYGRLVEAVGKFRAQSARIKSQIEKLNNSKAEVSDKIRRIGLIKKKAHRIIKKYVSETTAMKERMIG